MSQKLASGALAAARRLGQSAVSRRGLASGSDYLVSAPHPSIERVQVVTMQRAPVNQLDLDFLKAFPAKIKELEEDANTHGFILTSAQPKTFSAGLDIPFLFDKEEAFLRDFGAAFQDCWAALYGTPLAVVAAVNGHALAGGCLLAAAADYRIADKSATIGLPEVHLGILAPYYLREMVKQLMGHRACEWALITGHALSADLSQSLGLVDEVKDSVAEVNKSADAMIKLLTTLNPKGRSESKVSMRQDLLDRTAARRQQNIDEFAAVIHDKEVQTSIRQYFEALAKKHKDKKQ